MKEEAKTEAKTDFEFFGDVDRAKNGEIGSSYPVWYNPAQIEMLEDDIKISKTAITQVYSQADKREIQEQLDIQEKKLKKIKDSIPILTASRRDYLMSQRKEMGEALTDSMPSARDNERGNVDILREVRFKTQPCLKLDPEIARKCGIRLDKKGMASRDEVARAWKITSRLLDEESNTEFLRRT